MITGQITGQWKRKNIFSTPHFAVTLVKKDPPGHVPAGPHPQKGTPRLATHISMARLH